MSHIRIKEIFFLRKVNILTQYFIYQQHSGLWQRFFVLNGDSERINIENLKYKTSFLSETVQVYAAQIIPTILPALL